MSWGATDEEALNGLTTTISKPYPSMVPNKESSMASYKMPSVASNKMPIMAFNKVPSPMVSNIVIWHFKKTNKGINSVELIAIFPF